MSLINSPEILKQIYDISLKNQTSIDFILKDITLLHQELEKYITQTEKRINKLETYTSYLKGYLFLLTLILSAFIGLLLK